jgi:hypothetical protein
VLKRHIRIYYKDHPSSYSTRIVSLLITEIWPLSAEWLACKWTNAVCNSFWIVEMLRLACGWWGPRSVCVIKPRAPPSQHATDCLKSVAWSQNCSHCLRFCYSPVSALCICD